MVIKNNARREPADHDLRVIREHPAQPVALPVVRICMGSHTLLESTSLNK